MNASKIQAILRANYDHNYVLENSFIFYWESDYFGITKTGYTWEIEVKVSVSDFRADFNKNFKHRCLRFNKQKFVSHKSEEVTERVKSGNKVLKHGRMVDEYIVQGKGYSNLQYSNNVIPNRFYYAVPVEIAAKVKQLIPKYAGLISIDDKNHIFEVKKAPLLHREKMLDKLKDKLLSKFYWLSERQRKELNNRQIKLGL